MSSKEKQIRQRYTAELKEQAVRGVLSGHAVTTVARELGGDSLIHNWLARHRQQAGEGAVQALQLEFPVFAAVAAEPLTEVVVRFVGKTHGDVVAGKGPRGMPDCASR